MFFAIHRTQLENRVAALGQPVQSIALGFLADVPLEFQWFRCATDNRGSIYEIAIAQYGGLNPAFLPADCPTSVRLA